MLQSTEPKKYVWSFYNIFHERVKTANSLCDYPANANRNRTVNNQSKKYDILYVWQNITQWEHELSCFTYPSLPRKNQAYKIIPEL